MSNITIIAAGKNKAASPYFNLWSEYLKRMSWQVRLIEIEAKDPKIELKKLKDKINPSFPLIGLDEKGKTMGSVDFAHKVDALRMDGHKEIQFILGGADGLDDEMRANCAFLMSFGKQTWPHMMARCMLIEQLYRAQQIIAHHPYHREG